jgi:hypothetical protein
MWMILKGEEVQVALLLSQHIDCKALEHCRHTEDALQRTNLTQLAEVALEEELRS